MTLDVAAALEDATDEGESAVAYAGSFGGSGNDVETRSENSSGGGRAGNRSLAVGTLLGGVISMWIAL